MPGRRAPRHPLSAARPTARSLPVGAEPLPGGTHFRVWAPAHAEVEVVLEGEDGAPGGTREGVPLEPEENGYFSGLVAEATPGTLYRFRLGGGERLFPDPASRYQPQGPHRPSRVVDPQAFPWTDEGWTGVGPDNVLYEIHLGTFTPEGTWNAAREKLPYLAELGVTVVEVMPIADFPGRFGWGYDGVALFAPYHGYGEPDDFRAFVNAAHGAGLGVILDVVYNHLGPDGNYLAQFSEHYTSRTHTTDWGDALNFDGPSSAAVRELCLANVRHWIEEYHLDGCRFDATQDLHDDGPDHILGALGREARAAAPGRRLLLIAENEPQHAHLVRAPHEGGLGLDAIGNEDFHHTAVVALTGRRQGYYSPYLGSAQELVSAVKHGFLYQGQWYPWQTARRGTWARGLDPRAFVHFLENHDQVANTADGRRLHQLAPPARWRAMVALQLLGPQTPFLFQGQEFHSSVPFLYFADHEAELAKLVRKGRLEFLSQFEDLASPEVQDLVPDPVALETFRACKLDWEEVSRNGAALELHRDLLRLREEDGPLSYPRREVDGALLGPQALVLRGFGGPVDGSQDRLVLVNLGPELVLSPAPEPLLAPPTAAGWKLVWSSADPRYGGWGTPAVETEAWNLPGDSTLVLAPAAHER